MPAGLQVEPVLVLGPDAEHHHVDVAEVRPPALDRRQVGLAPAGDQRQVLAGRGADVRRVARVPEVGVPVDEDQPDPAADRLAEPVHGQRRAEQRSSSRRRGPAGTRPASMIAPIRSASAVE